MRVCHIWHYFLPSKTGGVERYILTLSNFLGDQYPEMKFSLITDNTEYPFFESRKILKFQKYGNLDVYRFGPNLLSVCKGFYFSLTKHNSRFFAKLLNSKLCLEMSNNKRIAESDIFHVHGLWDLDYPKAGLYLSQHFNKPLVVSLHGDNVGSEFFYSMPLESKECVSILRKSAAITTYSQIVLNTLINLGLGDRSHLIPNFVNTRKFNRPTPLGEGSGTRVVMICRLDPFKDPLTAVRAFARVVKKEPEATLEIIGEGPLYEPIKCLIQKLGLVNSVFLRGIQTDVSAFLWKSDILLTGNAYLSILEAWSAGLAVVASREETTTQLISDRNNGFLVPPKDPNNLAAAILELMANKKIRVNLAKNGLNQAYLHDITVVAPKISSIYSSVLKR